MIARLIGLLHIVAIDRVIMDVGGVGYDVSVPVGTPGRAPTLEDGRVTLLVHTSVREDAISLFGFATEQEKRLFMRLTSITGVGPRLGLAILSDLSPSRVVRAIRNSDTATLKQVSGVGKKTAQRLILEMKSAIDDFEFAELAPPDASADTAASDLRSALQNMGFDAASVDSVVARVVEDTPDDAALEALLRDALKLLR